MIPVLNKLCGDVTTQWDLSSLFTLEFPSAPITSHISERGGLCGSLTFGSSPRRSRNFGGGFLFVLIPLSIKNWAQLSGELLTSPVCTHWGCSNIHSECRVCLHGSSLTFFISVFSLLQYWQALRHGFLSTLSNKCYKAYERFETIMYERVRQAFWKGEN